MTIQEANNEIKKATNLLKLYIDRKNTYFQETQPKSKLNDSEHVDGGNKRVDKFLKYVYKCDKNDIDWWIDKLNDDIVSLTTYVESELKRIGEYEPLKAKVIKLREENKTWEEISMITHYSESQCRRIYKEYTNKRYN